jgi:NADH dehydrogenase [ubiquinone] 1 alpha subcomplex assembly factor 1
MRTAIYRIALSAGILFLFCLISRAPLLARGTPADTGVPQKGFPGIRAEGTILPEAINAPSVCPSGQIECNGNCFTGNCCNDGDCPSGRQCISHTCQGWESKPLPVSPSAFLEYGPAYPAVEAGAKPEAAAAPLSSPVALYDTLPMQGPAGTHPVTATLTQNFLNVTNAVEAYSVDFVDDQTAEHRAQVFALKTLDGAYGHDYSVCERFHGFTLDAVTYQAYPDLSSDAPWFWQCTIHKDTAVERALLFTVLVDEDATPAQFLVDSRWLDDYYKPNPIYPPYDYMLNFQIWSRSSEGEAADLMRRTIDNLKKIGTLSFFNTTQPISPTVFIKAASYSAGTIHLAMQSSLAESRTVHFLVSMRPYTDTTIGLELNFDESVMPGTNPIELPVNDMLDAVVLSQVDDFLDKVYVGNGFWFVFGDGQSAVVRHDPVCDGRGFENALELQGCAGMTGTITTASGFVGLARTLNPNGMPVDVSGYRALTFMARGDGKSYQVKIETNAVKDRDYHQFVFTPPVGEWRQYIIPLSSFKQQGWGTAVPLTATDVKSVAWASVGAHSGDAVQLDIDRVAFINSPVISDTSGPASTNDVFGSHPITSAIEAGGQATTATLHYSINSGAFIEVPMSVNGHTFTGQIPGQPMGSEVSYYVEARDADGNLAADPVDAPHAAHHFRVEWYPSLLADDFGDSDPYNVLGGWSGIFTDPAGGGVITPCYWGNALSLSFDVANHIAEPEWAGYYSKLERTDLSPYNSVVFPVRGANGGEKLRTSLNDGHGHEPKIELSEYLPNGVTADWQTVRIPLPAFASITDWSAMNSFNLLAEESIQSGSGTLYVDDLSFRPDAWPIRLDNYNDLDDQNGVGLLHDTDIGAGASLDVGYDQTKPYGGTGASLALTYHVSSGTYAAWQSGLGGLDASGYDKLSFVVRGANGGENFHVWLVDQAGHSAWVSVSNYTTVANTWPATPVEIPLWDFAGRGVDLTQLSLFKVAFEWEAMSGTIYLDDIQFELPPPPAITALSPIAASNQTSTTLALTGTNFMMQPTVALGYHPLQGVTRPTSTTLTAIVPAGIPSGVYDVWVIQPNLQSGVMSRAFSVGGKIYIYIPVVLKNAR